MTSYAPQFNEKNDCDPASKIVDIYARITEEVVDWIRKKTDGAKKSNCDDI